MNSTKSLQFSAFLLGAALLLGGPALAAVYDVTAYGAQGDGVTNDTAAIQAAVDAAAAAGGGIVSVPAGAYLVTEISFAQKPGVILAGESHGGSVLRKYPGSYSDQPILLLYQTSDVEVRDLKIDGNAASVSGSILGVKISKAQRVKLTKVAIENILGTGVSVYDVDTDEVAITASRFVDIDDYGIRLGWGWSRVQIHDNYFELIDDSSIYYYGSGDSGLSVVGNVFENSSTFQTLLLSWGGLSDVLISGNIIRDGRIGVRDLASAVISNNEIFNDPLSTEPALKIERGNGPTVVANNTIESPAGIGVRAEGPTGNPPTDFSLTGNRIQAGSHGISLSGCEKVLVTDNSVLAYGETASGLEHIGVLVSPLGTNTPAEKLVISDNQIGEFGTGIKLNPSRSGIDTVNVTGNVIHSSYVGGRGLWAIATGEWGHSLTQFQAGGNLIDPQLANLTP